MLLLRVPAQVPNDSLYFRLLQSYFATHPGPYRAVETAFPDLPRPIVALDSAADDLRIGPPRLTYERLAKKRYLRQLQLSLSQGDSSQAGQVIHIRDTLDLAALREVRRDSPLPLQGENPTYAALWLRPVAIIGGSIAAILALFLIRTPS